MSKDQQWNEDQLWSEVVRLRKENESCRRSLNSKKEELDQLNKQVVALNEEVGKMKSEIRQVTEVKEKEMAKVAVEEAALTGQVISAKEKEGVAEEKKIVSVKTPAVEDRGKEVDLASLRIKVLSGDGNLSTARNMSKKLVKMGYKVERIDTASRKNFTVSTVFFAKEYKKEAGDIAARLGGNTISKPLTWSTVFHIIIVAVH